MKKRIFTHCMLIASLLLTACSGGNKAKVQEMTPSEVEKLVTEAYVHCFPIVENYKALYFYGVDKTSDKYSPGNTLTKTARLYTPDDTFIITPNNDTYYTKGMLDLRAEPVIIKVPEANGRYYVIQLVDMLTNNFDYIGTNSTGSAPGVYAITGPSWNGTLPAGIKQIKSPSQFIFVNGRTGVNGEDPKDVQLAKKFQQEMEIGGMSKFYPETKPVKVEAINFPVWTEDVHTTTYFFELLNFLLPYTELPQKELEIIESYKSIGVEAGKPYNFLNDNPTFKDAVTKGMIDGLARVNELGKHVVEKHNGWLCAPFIRFFGDHYDLRTAVARIGIYGLDPFEAHYPFAHFDGKGELLDGNNDYTLTFPAGQLPPVKFFWSITMYDGVTQLLVHNPINRYSMGDRTRGLKYNKDGSLTIHISQKAPKEGTSNWLPAPAGRFSVVMRLYGPKESVVDLTWLPQPIVKR